MLYLGSSECNSGSNVNSQELQEILLLHQLTVFEFGTYIEAGNPRSKYFDVTVYDVEKRQIHRCLTMKWLFGHENLFAFQGKFVIGHCRYLDSELNYFMRIAER